MEALALDDDDRLIEEFSERVQEAVRTWRAEEAWDSATSTAD